MKKDLIEMEGEVIEALPNAMFRVKLQTSQVILTHISGRLRMHFIKIVEGDRVLVQMSPYDLTKGRIIRRL
jgi:translation initiation factor IF-1